MGVLLYTIARNASVYAGCARTGGFLAEAFDRRGVPEYGVEGVR
jgi:hypothetical protein